MTPRNKIHGRRSVAVTLAVLSLLLLPSPALAGGGPVFTLWGWGIGEMENRFTLELGRDRYIKTPIPTPPQGPRWDVAYRSLPFISAGAACVLWLCRRRHRTSRGRGFEVRSVRTAPPRGTM